MTPPNMLLWSASTCDFVSHAAQCPTNRLPIYKNDFAYWELEEIDAMMGQPFYIEADGISRYLLSARIEARLEPVHSPRLVFDLLISGLQERPDLFENNVYMAELKQAGRLLFVDALDSAAFNLWRTPDENWRINDKVWRRLLFAYAMSRSGDRETARLWLSDVKAVGTDVLSEFDQIYLERIEACLETPEVDACQPTAIVEHELEGGPRDPG